MRTNRIKLAGKCFTGMALAVLALLFVDCSGDAPLQPTQDVNSGQPVTVAPPEGQVTFVAVVASVDVATRTLTFQATDYVVIADDDCEIVRLVAGVATIVDFDNIVVEDSIRVCGIVQEDGTVLANRIRIYSTDGCINYDLEFRDEIATIDYAAGTFTVVGRSETIIVGSNTVIWTVIGGGMATAEGGSGSGDGVGRQKEIRQTILAFTDLAVGYVVEVKALIEDTETLQAVSIKVAGESFSPCLEFEAALATIDLDTRTVTFDGSAWIGWICQNALLLDADGTPLLLEDFAIGDYVAVKGSLLEGDTLKVCSMTRQ